MTNFSRNHLNECVKIIELLDDSIIEKMADVIDEVRTNGGRLFFLGVGGSAGNASHCVNDFRKIVGIESYAPTDNVSELTARTNDEGWDTIFAEWLKLKIPLPSIKEQKKIVEIIENCESKISQYVKHKSQLETIKKGLMQKLLTGQMRVKI